MTLDRLPIVVVQDAPRASRRGRKARRVRCRAAAPPCARAPAPARSCQRRWRCPWRTSPPRRRGARRAGRECRASASARPARPRRGRRTARARWRDCMQQMGHVREAEDTADSANAMPALPSLIVMPAPATHEQHVQRRVGQLARGRSECRAAQSPGTKSQRDRDEDRETERDREQSTLPPPRCRKWLSPSAGPAIAWLSSAAAIAGTTQAGRLIRTTVRTGVVRTTAIDELRNDCCHDRRACAQEDARERHRRGTRQRRQRCPRVPTAIRPSGDGSHGENRGETVDPVRRSEHRGHGDAASKRDNDYERVRRSVASALAPVGPEGRP